MRMSLSVSLSLYIYIHNICAWYSISAGPILGQMAVEGDASVSSIKYLSTSVNSKYNYKYKYKVKYHVSCVNSKISRIKFHPGLRQPLHHKHPCPRTHWSNIFATTVSCESPAWAPSIFGLAHSAGELFTLISGVHLDDILRTPAGHPIGSNMS